MTIAEQLRDQALRLPAEDRALIARDLLQSLEAEDSPESTEAAWLEELEARAEAYDAGRLSADDWQVSLERVRRRLHERRQL